MSFPPYENHKDTGIEWLGEIPIHWEVIRLKFLGNAIIGLTYDPSEVVDEGQGALVLRSSNVQDGRIVFDDNVYVRRDIPEKLILRGGDVLICSRNGSRALIGKNAMIAEKPAGATFGAFMTVFRSELNSYLFWLFNSPLFAFQSAAFLTSTINQLTVGTLNGFEVPVPPESERPLIGMFLKRETTKIDALVTEQQRLIELLKEKRQAVISHAVTKGLNQAAPMKESGIEWLGKVPAHWKLRPLKHLAKFKSGGTPDKSRMEFWEGDIPWASAKDLKVEVLNDTEDHITKFALDSGAATLIPAGSLLVVVRGMILARAFPVVRANVNMAINQDLKAVVPKKGMTPDYLTWLLRGSEREILSQLDEAAHGTKALRMDKWGSMLMPVPPQEEQTEIVSHIENTCTSLSALVNAATQAICLLQERRAALISAAVTGKIDVRGLVASRPEVEIAA
jgi:type I restriction enzyme, S subunit